MHHRLSDFTFFAALLSALTACAIDASAQAGPPAAAFNACQGQSERSSCHFQAPHGTVNGICRNMREGRLVCVPARRPSPMQSRQPIDIQKSRPAPFGADIAADNPDAIPVSSRVPDTNQGSCFDNSRQIPCPKPGEPFYGQDGNYTGAAPAYRDNHDGTISDTVTGLTWEKAHHDKRLGYYAAAQACSELDLGNHRDWRLPTIKELFSIADFRGSQGRRPYIADTFEFHEPDASVLQGDRFAATHSTGMMGQTWSSTIYTGVHFGRPGVEAAFFFNFLDGHIKQAPIRGRSALFYRCVRGPRWGENRFTNREKNSVRDEATGLTWQQRDNGRTYDWQHALAYCQELNQDGHSDWRLPNIKELQSIVDYRHHAPAIDEHYLQMSNAKAWFWSSTTHGDNIRHADYVCFGACTAADGTDTHGAGAQRSDPKAGNPSDFGTLGGQHDEVRIQNHVRCVR